MENPNDDKNLTRIIDILLKIGALIWLMTWSYLILLPFISIVLWSIIIAIVLNPLYARLKKTFKGRGKVASFVVATLVIAVILLPAIWLSGAIFQSVEELTEIYRTGQLVIPPPGDRVKDWPSFTKPLVDTWQLASTNLLAVVSKYQNELRATVGWMIQHLAQTGLAFLELFAAIIIGSVLLSYGKESGQAAEKIFARLAGSKGLSFLELCEGTIRTTVSGVLAVSIIQALMAGLGMIVMGVPLAGLWFIACLILSIMQIGTLPVLIPAAIYIFFNHDIVPSILFAVWAVIITVSDNILKPFFMRRAKAAPALVVFLGSIGGFAANGFLGLFLGPVVLSLAYNLLVSWMNPADTLPTP